MARLVTALPPQRRLTRQPRNRLTRNRPTTAMTIRPRTLIALAVTTDVILTAAIWWRSAHRAPTAAPAPPPAATTTSVPTTASRPATSASLAVAAQHSPSATSGTSASQTSPSPDTPEQVQVDPSPGATPSAQTSRAREQWRPVILGFARAYTSHRDDPAAWRATLARYSSPAVNRALANSTPEQAATHSRYASYDILEYHEDEVDAQVNYADGTALVLYVAREDGGRSWAVRAFDRLAQ